ncbi:TIGR03943 family protein [Bacillus sp. V3-13]|uniref:TIGR03943 family putative permease subunit n=1 Tax=Bacillus sp. V3-13 TaxID=2053728 RepID=UPI000C75E9B4|nr:TIGR03943 family protein [Bacillus sp. V3-13]PLR78506.1 TIGR03943 family protein [Bacillus sp. V3-13]
MRFHFQYFLRAVILAAFAIFFIKLHYTGEITKYINPKYELMSQIAAGVFIFFFFIQLFRAWEHDSDKHAHCPPGCSHDHGYSDSLSKKLISYSIIIFPLITGYALSLSVLDSSIAAKKGTLLPEGSNETLPDTENNDDIPISNNNYLSKKEYDEKMKKLDELDVIQMKEDIFASYYQSISSGPKAFSRKRIKLSGFVYKEEGFSSNQLVISRFIITHCIADAGIIGFLTEFEHASEYEQDTWVEIEGTLDVTTYNGVEIPIIKAENVEVIDEPADPYIYPVLTKVTE